MITSVQVRDAVFDIEHMNVSAHATYPELTVEEIQRLCRPALTDILARLVGDARRKARQETILEIRERFGASG